MVGTRSMSRPMAMEKPASAATIVPKKTTSPKISKVAKKVATSKNALKEVASMEQSVDDTHVSSEERAPVPYDRVVPRSKEPSNGMQTKQDAKELVWKEQVERYSNMTPEEEIKEVKKYSEMSTTKEVMDDLHPIARHHYNLHMLCVAAQVVEGELELRSV